MGPDSEGYPEDNEFVRMTDLLNYHFSTQLIYFRDYFFVENIVFFAEKMRVSNEIVRFTEHLFELAFSAVNDAKRRIRNIRTGTNLATIARNLCGNQEIFKNPATQKYIEGYNQKDADPLLYEIARKFIEGLKV